jgi:hypothetical protein
MKPIFLLFLAISICSGCGNGTSDDNHSNVCDDSTDTVPFELGMNLDSNDGKFSLKVESADPNPIDRGDNTWTVILSDSGANPVSDATIVLEPTMPGHGHGTFPATFDGTSGSTNGAYDFGPFDLMMPGTWQLEFTITDSENATSTATATFCVES